MLIRWASERWRKQFFAIISIALSCAFFFLRINNISIHPLFVDEAISIHISERIAETSPFVDAWQGRLFSVWALFPFQPHLAASAFIPRAITVLAQLPALLALVVLAKRKAGDWAALLAFLFFLFSPYHIFFNRIALPDAFASAFQLLAIALSWRWLHRPRPFNALVIGITLFLAFGAKINSVIYFAIPFAAWLSQKHLHRMRRQSWQWLLLATLTAILLTIALVIFLSLLGQDFLTTFNVHRGSPASFTIARYFQNAENSFNLLSQYLSLPLLLVGLLSLCYLGLVRDEYLPLATLAPMLAIWSVQTQQSRFWMTATTLLLLAAAMVLGRLIQRGHRLLSICIFSGMLLWLLTWALPFLIAARNKPERLPLPPPDAYQYLQGESAGLAIREVHAALIPHEPQLVLGIVSNCLSLRYFALSDFPVLCPRVNYSGEDIPSHRALLEDERAPGVYAVLDSTPFTPAKAPGRLLHVIDSPGGAIRYSIYDLSPTH